MGLNSHHKVTDVAKPITLGLGGTLGAEHLKWLNQLEQQTKDLRRAPHNAR